jgi:hypothetical protein
MTRPRYYKAMFYAAAIFNWIAAAGAAFHASGALGISLQLDPLGRQLFALFVALFGYGYFIVGRDITRNEGIVWLGIIGKPLAFAVLLVHAIAGEVPFAVVIAGTGDLIFTILFIEFLRNGRPQSV